MLNNISQNGSGGNNELNRDAFYKILSTQRAIMKQCIVIWGFLLSSVCYAVDIPANSLHVLSYNIRHGVGMDEQLDLARTAKVITASGADIVCVQEVDQLCARSGKMDQAAELGRLCGMNYTFGKAMDFDGGAYGLAVLSRWNIIDSKVHHLPGSGEPRILLETIVDAPGGRLCVSNVHFTHLKNPGEREQQARTVYAALIAGDFPTILAGDFNDGPQSAAINVFRVSPWVVLPKKGAQLTCPADRPKSEIDYVMVKGLHATQPLVVLDEPLASDHRPVMVVLHRD